LGWVNQLFYEKTADSDYATFLFAEYTIKRGGYATRIVGISPLFSFGARTVWNDCIRRPPSSGFSKNGIPP
jgi:hypothetical protein